MPSMSWIAFRTACTGITTTAALEDRDVMGLFHERL